MIELRNWINAENFPDKPWLVLGKGPTFEQRHRFDLTKFNMLALNHAVREVKVDVAHLIDIDVVESCGETIFTNCDWLLMPNLPNVRFFPSEYFDLTNWLSVLPMLQKVETTNRLVTYNFSHDEDTQDPWEIVARYFSSEAALGILGRMGVKKVYTLGVDGGTAYGSAFEDLEESTRLASGVPSFDLQFGRLDAISHRFGMTIEPLVPYTNPRTSAETDATTNNTNRDVGARLPYIDGMLLEVEYPTLSFAKKLVDTRTESYKRALSSEAEQRSMAEKMQQLEEDMRYYRAHLEQAHDQLTKVSKDLTIAAERLTWSRNETRQYRTRNSALEAELHGMLKSGTWKLGRALTKPAAAIFKPPTG